MGNMELKKLLENARLQASEGNNLTEFMGTYILFCQLVNDEMKLPEVSKALFDILNS